MKTLDQPKVKSEIINRIHSLSPDSTKRWGKMSVEQMICHVTDQLRLATGDKPPYPQDDLFKRTLIKWLILYVTAFPRGAPTIMELDQQLLGTQPSSFEADKKALVDQIEVFVQRTEPYVQHSYFGPLTRREWSRMAYLHLNHHLKQFGV